jgi:hypothetical protein
MAAVGRPTAKYPGHFGLSPGFNNGIHLTINLVKKCFNVFTEDINEPYMQASFEHHCDDTLLVIHNTFKYSRKTFANISGWSHVQPFGASFSCMNGNGKASCSHLRI